MHKDIPVAELLIDEAVTSIQQIVKIYDAHHFPVSVFSEHYSDEKNRRRLNNWWKNRLIPASRSGFRHRMKDLGIESREELLLRCFSLSLSDQYWMKPADSALTWESINFFNNPFSDDVGNILFGEPVQDERVDLMSPCNTSDGVLKKKWKIVDGRRCLIKGGSRPFQQEPLNEVVASHIQRALHKNNFVEYQLWPEKAELYSVCNNFVTEDMDFVNAGAVYGYLEKITGESQREHFLRCCDALGIPGVTELLNHMLTLDFLIANEDRHFGNFGFLRDVNSLEFQGPAPVFDNGSSMWYKEVTSMIHPGGKLNHKPFEDYGFDQLGFVSDFGKVDFQSLRRMEDTVYELYKQSPYLDGKRVETLCGAYMERINEMEKWGI